MPNWCEGSIKIRGKFENVKLFCKEVFRVYSFKKTENGLENVLDESAMKVECDSESEFWMCIEKDAYIKGTRRNFVESGDLGFFSDKKGNTIAILNFKAAWAIESDPYIKLSEKYGVDIRIYGFERGMEFNQEVIVEQGKLVKDEEITFDDYEWDCPMPNIGG